MDFAPSPRTLALQEPLERFMQDLVLPSLGDWHRYADAGVYPLDVLEPLKARARGLDLWNLFLPSLRDDQPGTRLGNLDYAPLAECMGRVPWAAEIFNCSAPDSGNIELLQMFASATQRERWLDPLLAGEIRSCFAMSEPDVGSSDPTQLQTRIERDGDTLVLHGRKWFITGAAHPLCRVALVLGRDAGAAAQSLGASVLGYASSGLPGPKGNLETFVWLAEGDRAGVADLASAVAEVEPVSAEVEPSRPDEVEP